MFLNLIKFFINLGFILFLSISCVIGSAVIPSDQIDEMCRTHQVPCIGLTNATLYDTCQTNYGLRGTSITNYAVLLALEKDASVQFGCDPQKKNAYMVTHTVNFVDGAGHLQGNPREETLDWSWFIDASRLDKSSLTSPANAFLMISCITRHQ